MKRYHWSSKPFKLDTRIYNSNSTFKPDGFWYDTDEDWKKWCISENFRLKDLTHKHEVIIPDSFNLLKITNESEFDAFNSKYRRATKIQYLRDVDWPKIVQEYDGIEISPYFWSKRLSINCSWYYSWDVASGCVWRNVDFININLVEVIPFVEPLEPLEEEQKQEKGE